MFLIGEPVSTFAEHALVACAFTEMLPYVMSPTGPGGTCMVNCRVSFNNHRNSCYIESIRSRRNARH